jgi:hypothetical protein
MTGNGVPLQMPDSHKSCTLPLKNLLRSVILVLSNTKGMSSFSPFDGGTGGNMMGCFGTILARSWYMADEPPSHSDLGAQSDWLFLLLSDQNRVRAAGLHAAYYQCRDQITNDKPALEVLEQQHYNMQCSVTPIHRFPAEIMMEILYIVIDVGQLRGELMHVCRRWYKLIEGMAGLWASLALGAETTLESVHHLLSRAGTHPLAVEIDIDKAKCMEERLQLSLAMVGSKASQWQTLTIASLPQDEHLQYNHAPLSTQFQSMTQLRHLNIAEPVLSPLLIALLQNIATAAVGTLVSMEIHSFSAAQYLLRPAHSLICCSLTTFIAKVPKMNQPVDLLPHFMQLEVLELTNLLLPILDHGSPLPLAHTLHRLYVKSVSIQWMGGRVFSRLENCTIIAPLTDRSLHHDVQLPACTELHVENWNISPIGQFFAPTLDQMRVMSNARNPYKGNAQVVRLVRAGFGMALQPKSLSLSVTCKDTVLLAVLQLLPELVELKLDLPRPSTLGKRFFTGLLAKPGNQVADNLKFDWRELFRDTRTERRCTICPYLRDLELKYQQWLRPGHNNDFLPPLFALSWSREKTIVPLQLHVHYKTSMHSWESFDSQAVEGISCLRVPYLGHLNDLSLETKTWKSAVFENAHVIPLFSHVQRLVIILPRFERQVLNVLPSFHELRELTLSRVRVPPIDVDLPLLHTLRKLSLRSSTLAWMDGLVFTQLQRFSVDELGWPDTFKQKVGMPACIHVEFNHDRLKTLPILQSNFHLPLLITFQLGKEWGHSDYDKRGISALQQIHAKELKFWISSDHQGLPKALGPNDEVERLELIFIAWPASATALEVLAGVSVTNAVTREFPCPNMKELRLLFSNLVDEDWEKVIQSSMRIMNNRRLAGHSLEKCYLWRGSNSWGNPATSVLIMENETVRIEG